MLQKNNPFVKKNLPIQTSLKSDDVNNIIYHIYYIPFCKIYTHWHNIPLLRTTPPYTTLDCTSPFKPLSTLYIHTIFKNGLQRLNFFDVSAFFFNFLS